MYKRYEISANYTVEAAFVVPIILGMIFSMIYMLFVSVSHVMRFLCRNVM